jgi:hypothetical protein
MVGRESFLTGYGATSARMLGYLHVDVVTGDAERQRGAHSRGARQRAALVVLSALALVVMLPAVATARTKLVQYHGYRLAVPAGWPVYRLAADPTTCVRFNRHAVYLGNPSSEERCPAHAAGRTEAILIEPLSASAAGATGSGDGGVLPSGGNLARVALPARGVVVTATWAAAPGVIERALGRRVHGNAAIGAGRAPRASAAAKSPVGRTAVAGATFTGLGFDSCSAPSPAALQAWTVSPFRAFGIYVGGAEVACAQPNLTAAYVAQATADGWNLIPTYVGLQAPGNGCSCAAIKPADAAAEGTAAAQDAVVHAQALGIGSGSPIYYDMEAYAVTAKDTAAVRTFLAAWTTQLHAAGYVSGVYGSSDSVIADLAAVDGTGYVEPDDLWIANWNNEESTADPNVPTTDWSDNQRIHQYRGGHNDDYGKVKLNIDTDYVDGSVAGSGGQTITGPAPAPVLSVSPASNGNVAIHASWDGETGITAWQILAGNSATTVVPFGSPNGGGQSRTITVHSQFSYYGVQAIGATGTALGSSVAIPTPPHLAIFGRSIFVPPHGLAGVPVGCYVLGGCNVVTTLTAGSTVVAQTGADPIGAGSGGIAFFKLSSAGRKLLTEAASRRLAVRVTETDNSGATGGAGAGTGGQPTVAPAWATLELVPYTTSGPAAAHSLTDAPAVRVVSGTEFVYVDSVGGVLTDCMATIPCNVTTKLWHGHTTLAQTGEQQIGAGELGYISFKLTPAGRKLLQTASGNQLTAHLLMTDDGAGSGGQVVLVGYH